MDTDQRRINLDATSTFKPAESEQFHAAAGTTGTHEALRPAGRGSRGHGLSLGKIGA